MGAIPGNLETDAGPPMAIPLRHFVVGLGFLLAGGVVGLSLPFDVFPGRVDLVHVHLLLVGWVCVTIMGAMTQFVPVWSGTSLHSRRLANAQLGLVVAGLVGFALALLAASYSFLAASGGVMLLGFWVFVYNLARTLPGRPWDVTERHFAIALGFFVLVTILGFLLALGYASPAIALPRESVRQAHATLAVFGAVLTTVFGALYQLGTMFTQSDLHDVDHYLRRIEEVGYPIGVVALATGRLLDHASLARGGSVLVVAGVVAIGAILARRLYETHVEVTPMLARYAVAAGAMALWSILAFPAWLDDPTRPPALFGAPSADHVLLLGIVGFVVLGTLYHVVPFIVWVHRYSDRLGLADVPMIDDLYDDRLATIDFSLTLLGGGLFALAEALALSKLVLALGGGLTLAGFVVFVLNVGLVIREHAPHSLSRVILGSLISTPPESSET